MWSRDAALPILWVDTRHEKENHSICCPGEQTPAACTCCVWCRVSPAAGEKTGRKWRWIALCVGISEPAAVDCRHRRLTGRYLPLNPNKQYRVKILQFNFLNKVHENLHRAQSVVPCGPPATSPIAKFRTIPFLLNFQRHRTEQSENTQPNQHLRAEYECSYCILRLFWKMPDH